MAALPWNTNIEELPFNTPVLVKRKGYTWPFMVIRDSEFNPDQVGIILGSDEGAYGIYHDVTEMEAFLLVM